jgi:hypothetical protein
MASAYYAWRAVAKPVEVDLSLAVVDRIQALIAAARGRGEDGVLFGVLLGKSRRDHRKLLTIVHDFEPLNIARLRGTPQAPEGCGLAVVGLYHSRPGAELRLDHIDAALIRPSFKDPAMVYLLIQPERDRASRAAFFIQEQGDVHGYASYLEFPFHSQLLRESGSLSYGAPRRNRRVGWIAAATVTALAAIGLFGFVLSGGGGQDAPEIPVAQPMAVVQKNEPPAPPSSKEPRRNLRKNSKSVGTARAGKRPTGHRFVTSADQPAARTASASSAPAPEKPGPLRRLWARISNIKVRGRQ